MVGRKRLNTTLNVHCLSYLFTHILCKYYGHRNLSLKSNLFCGSKIVPGKKKKILRKMCKSVWSSGFCRMYENKMTPDNNNRNYVYWTVHHLDSWIKRDQLDVTCFFISLFTAQHVSDVNTSILRSLQLICWVISWVVLLWFDVCWCYVVVRLGWCGIWMQAEAIVKYVNK